MPKNNSKVRRAFRYADAMERQAEHAKRTPEQQLDLVLARTRGRSVATKEVNVLLSKIGHE